MKNLLLILILTISSCQPHKTGNVYLNEDLLKQDNISNIVVLNHKRIEEIKGDFNSYKIYLESLRNDKISSIAFAYDYINTCLSRDSIFKDSIFIYFQNKFYAVANMMTDSFETKYPGLVQQLNKNKKTTETKALEDNLKVCGLGMFTTEGTVYFDVVYDFFYDSFKNKVSEGLKEYLELRRDEMKQGFSEDAGLLISFDELSRRVFKWENFINKYPNHIYINLAKEYLNTYLETLLTGMDNSRTFEGDSLLPEVKNLYEKIIKENPTTGSSQIIASYYDLLSRHQFKENDSIPIFLKSNGLESMIGVQPHLR